MCLVKGWVWRCALKNTREAYRQTKEHYLGLFGVEGLGNMTDEFDEDCHPLEIGSTCYS